jgi:hypothetical protein
MYIEPCCCDNQLPRLLRQSGGSAVLFQTSGDVTLEHLMKAVMLMSGDRPRVLTLALPQLSASVLALLRRYMSLGWVAHLNLITDAPAAMADMHAVLAEIGVPMDCITYAPVTDARPLGLLMFAGPAGTVAIQGPICPAPTQGLHLYAALYGPSGSPLMRSFTDPITAYIKARAVEIEAPKADDAATSEAMSPSAEAEPKAKNKKKSRTPKGQRLESDTKTLT